MTRFFLLTVCFLILPPSLHAADTPPDILIGAYYFSGWWEESPNKYEVSGQDWREHFPGRIATLGEYNTQKTMDREIAAAADHGIHFFQFLWYFQGNEGGDPHKALLNAGVHNFINSDQNARMRFTVEYVNHPPFGIFDDAGWEKSCREWVGYMKHPRYLKVGGRAVFKIHGVDYFRQQSGGNAKVIARLSKLRDIARAQGVGELLIAGGVMASSVAKPEDVAMYDFLTTYMDVPSLPRHEEPYPYSDLLDLAKAAWKNYAAKSTKPYVPYVPAGWDPRPWHDSRASFAMPDDQDWMQALMDVKKSLAQHPEKLGVPINPPASTTMPSAAPVQVKLQKMILIYAWNEFAEGGYIAPTQAGGIMKLDVIQRVFAN